MHRGITPRNKRASSLQNQTKDIERVVVADFTHSMAKCEITWDLQSNYHTQEPS